MYASGNLATVQWVKASLLLILILTDQAAAKISVSFQSPTVKVFLDEPSLGTLSSYRIRMARGEYESFQMLVAAQGEDLHDISIEASRLTSAAVAKGRPELQVELNLIGYIKSLPDDRRPWGHARKIGWWPDPLLPNRDFDVKAGEKQPVWVTLFAPPGTPPGTYRGKLSVKTRQQHKSEYIYQVQLFNVDLPKKQTFRNAAFMPAGNLNTHYAVPGGLESAEFLQLYKRWAAFAFQHHLGPAFDMLMGWNQTKVRAPLEAGSLGPTPEMISPGDRVRERSFVTWPVRQTSAGYDFSTVQELIHLGAEYGLRQFCMAIFDREEKWEQQNPQVRSAMAEFLRAYLAQLQKLNLDQAAYVYNADEPAPEMWETVKKNFTFIKDIEPKLKVWLCLNEIEGVRALGGFTDIWDVYVQQYEKSGIEARRKSGEQVIWAVCVYPHEHPNLFVEYPAMDARMLGWLSYIYRVSGFEYWGLNQWGINAGRREWAPFRRGLTRTEWRRTQWPLGDGWLMYPGPDGEPLSSIRFENLRDGFEDAELLRLLEDEGMESEARSIARQVARTTQDFTSDPKTVDSARDALLQALARKNAEK